MEVKKVCRSIGFTHDGKIATQNCATATALTSYPRNIARCLEIETRSHEKLYRASHTDRIHFLKKPNHLLDLEPTLFYVVERKRRLFSGRRNLDWTD